MSGDLNSRIGALSDTLGEKDTTPRRRVFDNSTNQHGYTFVEFLNDAAKFCVLKGRFNEADDYFTSVLRKGRSVVDYICVPRDVFHCKSFKVQTTHHLYLTMTFMDCQGKDQDHLITESF